MYAISYAEPQPNDGRVYFSNKRAAELKVKTAKWVYQRDAKVRKATYFPFEINSLADAMEIILDLKERATSFRVYSSEDNYDWYFAISGFYNGKYFDFYINKREGNVTFEEAFTCKVTLKQIIKPTRQASDVIDSVIRQTTIRHTDEA